MKFVKQLCIILIVSFLAELMEYLIPLPIAASVYGLVLMLLGLITKIIPLKEVEGAADFLVEVMPIMFILPTVSIITCWDLIQGILVPLFVICLISTFLVMTVTGRVSQFIIRRGKRVSENASEGRKQ